jgi:hypothetical protein
VSDPAASLEDLDAAREGLEKWAEDHGVFEGLDGHDPELDGAARARHEVSIQFKEFMCVLQSFLTFSIVAGTLHSHA